MWLSKRFLLTRVLFPMWLLALGTGACTQGMNLLPTATATAPSRPLQGMTYTHPSEAFSLVLPKGWELVSEDAVSASFAPNPEAAGPNQATAIRMVVTHTGVPLSAEALEKFARQFALDACPQPGQCEVHGLQRVDAEVRVGMDYRPEDGGPVQRVHFTHRRVGAVIYTLIITAQGADAMPGVLRMQLWRGAHLNEELAARRLPLYAARAPFQLDFEPVGSRVSHPRVRLERPMGWASEQVSKHTAEVDYAHALAVSPDGLFALHVYMGHEAQPQYERLTDRAFAVLQDMLNLQPDAVVVEYQHMDLEGRWLLSWRAIPGNTRALTLATLQEGHLLLISGVTANSLWSLAEPFFNDLVFGYTYEK